MSEQAKYVPRLKRLYKEVVVKKLMEEFKFGNINEVPKLKKITLNVGLGEAVENPKIIDSVLEEIRVISGQQPVVTRARKSVAAFKLRQNQKIGCMVTLRSDKMWEFLDRLISFALPRVRDFKGVSPRSFDGRGNYSMGVTEQIIFPEINYDKISSIRGLGIVIVTSAKSDEHARLMLKSLGMPFRS